MLGPLLFVIYINDIDEGIVSKISKFADDTKLCAKVNNESEAEVLRGDLLRLYRWSEEWQMKFNIEKCSVMHVGRRNRGFEYKINDKWMRSTEEERDLGVIIHRSGKPTRQCTSAAAKANRMLGFIKRTMVSRERGIILNLYKTLVRPHLEYCVQVWNPYLQKDKDALERIQRRVTKMIKGMRNLQYEERLKRCNMTTLEKRRCRGDLIETFKIMTGGVTMDGSRFFQMANKEGLRGHRYKLSKRTDGVMKQRFFSGRVVNPWNELSDETVSVGTVEDFKKKLGLMGY